MTSWMGDWANLLLRWTHFIAGIAWIGSSFYFIWLDRALSAPAQPRPGVEGDLWMVHSGGFYQVEKRRPAPGEIPPVLHWFKYEALFTWITGIALLALVYYLTGAYLLDPNVSHISRRAALAVGVGLLVVGWLVYDFLWSSGLARSHGTLAAAISLTLLVAVSYFVCRLLSGRAAFMHVGSLLGTIMVANVWVRILPAQQEMLDATRAGRPADFTLGERAKVRSVHNSYMTFPLLFIMLSNHFPATYANPLNWLVLLLLFVAGAAVRHAMIGRGARAAWALLPAGLALAGAMFLSISKGAAARPTAAGGESVPAFVAVRAVITQRCQPCHSQYQADSSFGFAPGGVMFDTPESIARLAERIRVRAVETKTMPLNNKTGMTDEERALLARWISGGAPLR